MVSTGWLLISLLASVADARQHVQRASITTVTANGITYQGGSNTAGQTYYRGIPYAAPPTGKNRFRPPQSVTLSSGSSVSATAFQPMCHQFDDKQVGQSEDCLYLDVLVPKGTSSSAKLPVFFFIYGGAFRAGGSAEYEPYFSTLLSKASSSGQPFISVVANYRVGPWGFLVGKEAQAQGLANAGIHDQRFALEWVNRNIAAFGGDPSKVTLGGQSAGAISASIHMLRNGGNTDGLYRSVILESGTAGTLGIGGSSIRQSVFNALLKHAGCQGKSDPIACLLAIDEKHFHRAAYSTMSSDTYTFAPQVDGDVVPASPSTLYDAGKYANVPILAGDCLDEGSSPKIASISTQAEVVAYVQTLMPPIGVASASMNALVNLYSDAPADGSPYGTGSNTFTYGPLGKQAASVTGDIQFQAPRRQFLQAVASSGRQAYAYMFSEPSATAGRGAFHGSDMASWFGREKDSTGKAMVAYWINFISKGTPNGKGVATWPAYGTSGQMMNFMSGSIQTITDNFRSSQIAYIIKNSGAFFH